MSFDVGDRVVYPHHGAAIVARREWMEVFGETREYLILSLDRDRLTVMVPADTAEEVGLRRPIGPDEVEELFVLLRKEPRVPSNWSRRYKNHLEKLKSGDIYGVAEVVRNLWVQNRGKGLSAAEREMLGTARRILVSELAFALDVPDEEAERRLSEALEPAA